MLQTFLTTWTFPIIVSLFLIFVLVLFFIKKAISRKAIILGIVCFIMLQLVQIGLSRFLLYRSWEQSTGYEQYFTLRYSNKIYDLLTSDIERFGLHLALGVFIFFVFIIAAKKTKGVLLSVNDVLLLSLAAVITGWPNFAIAIGLIFALTICLKFIRIALRKEKLSDRIIITPAIPVATVIMVFFGNYLSALLGLSTLQ